MTIIRLRSPAKINLTLDVVQKRKDGFHDLESVFMEIPLYDEMLFSVQPDAETDDLKVSGKFAEGCPENSDNLVMKAIRLFRERLNPALPPLHIKLEKNIPSQAGLGGGSGNAAFALIACWRLSGSRHWYSELSGLAAELGSDCPFFIQRGLAKASGRGEVLEPASLNRKPYIIVAVPDVVVPTPTAFAGLEDQDKGHFSDHDELLRWLAGDLSVDFENLKLHNSFQRSVSKKFPEVAQTIELLKQCGATHAMLSGSGSACFGLFAEKPDSEALTFIREKVESSNVSVFRLLWIP